jgi:hypothetical protein
VSNITTEEHERIGYLRCNTIGHSWHDYDSSEWRPQFGTPLTLRCERCGTERRDVIGQSGDIIQRHYHYPAHYRYAKGTRPSRSEFRQMLLAQRIREAKEQRRLSRVGATA